MSLQLHYLLKLNVVNSYVTSMSQSKIESMFNDPTFVPRFRFFPDGFASTNNNQNNINQPNSYQLPI